VGLVHPLRLTEEQAAVLADAFESAFQLPFEQLNRRVFTLGPREWEAPTLTRFVGRTTTERKLRGLVERGWRLGPVRDAGFVDSLVRRLGDGTVVMLNISGFDVRGGSDEPVELDSIEFGDPPGDGVEVDEVSQRPLDTRSPVALSEVLRDVESIVDPEEPGEG
jgi:hypothetical protein